MRRSTIPEIPVSQAHELTVDAHQEDISSNDEQNQNEKPPFPENSRAAWGCLFGSFLMMLPSFGFQTAGMSTLNLLTILVCCPGVVWGVESLTSPSWNCSGLYQYQPAGAIQCQ